LLRINSITGYCFRSQAIDVEGGIERRAWGIGHRAKNWVSVVGCGSFDLGLWILEFGFKVRLRQINLIKMIEQSDTINPQSKI
jgi:hypothetical protein